MERLTDEQIKDLISKPKFEIKNYFNDLFSETGLNEYLQEGHELFCSGDTDSGLVLFQSFIIGEFNNKIHFSETDWTLGSTTQKLLHCVQPGRELEFAKKCREVLLEFREVFNFSISVLESIFEKLNKIEFFLTVRESLASLLNVEISQSYEQNFYLRIWGKNVGVEFLYDLNRTGEVFKFNGEDGPSIIIFYDGKIDSSELIKMIDFDSLTKLINATEMELLYTNSLDTKTIWEKSLLYSKLNQFKTLIDSELDERLKKLIFESDAYSLICSPMNKKKEDSKSEKTYTFYKSNKYYIYKDKSKEIICSDFKEFITRMSAAFNFKSSAIKCVDKNVRLEMMMC